MMCARVFQCADQHGEVIRYFGEAVGVLGVGAAPVLVAPWISSSGGQSDRAAPKVS
jgi:hypothetical protein